MPDPEKVWSQRFMAEAFLDSMTKMDLGIENSHNYSVVAGVDNQDLDAISFVWIENYMKDAKMKKELRQHLLDYDDGYLMRSLEYIVRKWVGLKGIDLNKALRDFSLIE